MERKKQYVYRRIVDAKLFIDKNFSDNLSLKQIASKAYYSRFHFIRLFKKIYGTTPSQYVISVRINKAKELLRSKTSTSRVCRAVGYESISSFKDLFKRKTTFTPANYKKRHSDLKSAMQENPAKFIPHCLTKLSAQRKNSNIRDTN